MDHNKPICLGDTHFEANSTLNQKNNEDGETDNQTEYQWDDIPARSPDLNVRGSTRQPCTEDQLDSERFSRLTIAFGVSKTLLTS